MKPTKTLQINGNSTLRIALFMLILAVGTWLRMDGIRSAGIRFDDESWYVSDARLWHRCAGVLAQKEARDALAAGDKKTVKKHLEEAGVDFRQRYQKPSQGYTMLGAGAMKLFGEEPEALLILNGFLGSVSILLVYLLGRVLMSTAGAMGAAALFAVSPYHLVYCRSALADATLIFFLLCGVYFWARGRDSRHRGWLFLLSGLAIGAAITCHYRSGYAVVVLLVVEVFLLVCERNRLSSSFLRRLGPVWLLGGMFIPIVVLESIFLLARYGAVRSGAEVDFPTYLQSLVAYLRGLSGRVGHSDGGFLDPTALTTYAGYIVHWHGWPLMILAMGGIVLALFRRSAAVILAAFVMATLLILASQRFPVARAFSPAIPFLCLTAGLVVERLVVGIRTAPVVRTGLAAIVVTAAAIPGWGHLAVVRDSGSSLADGCRILSREGAGTAVVPLDSRKYSLYLGSSGVRAVSMKGSAGTASIGEEIAALEDAGVRWVVVDSQPWHFRGAPSGDGVVQWWRELDRQLRRQARCIADLPHVSGREWDFLAEAWGPKHAAEMAEAEGGRMRIYELTGSMRTAEVFGEARAGEGGNQEPGSLVRTNRTR